jgi:hypothetical protein
MRKPIAAEVDWRTSTACRDMNCVEVGAFEKFIAVRSTGDPGAILLYTAAEWKDFVIGVKNGEFDDLG